MNIQQQSTSMTSPALQRGILPMRNLKMAENPQEFEKVIQSLMEPLFNKKINLFESRLIALKQKLALSTDAWRKNLLQMFIQAFTTKQVKLLSDPKSSSSLQWLFESENASEMDAFTALYHYISLPASPPNQVNGPIISLIHMKMEVFKLGLTHDVNLDSLQVYLDTQDLLNLELPPKLIEDVSRNYFQRTTKKDDSLVSIISPLDKIKFLVKNGLRLDEQALDHWISGLKSNDGSCYLAREFTYKNQVPESYHLMFQSTLEYIIETSNSGPQHLGKVYHSIICLNLNEKCHIPFQSRNIEPIIPELLTSRFELENYFKSYIHLGTKQLKDMSGQVRFSGAKPRVIPKPPEYHRSQIIFDTLKSKLRLPSKIDNNLIGMMKFIIRAKLDFFNDYSIRLEYLDIIELFVDLDIDAICESSETVTNFKLFFTELTNTWTKTFVNPKEPQPKGQANSIIEEKFRKFIFTLLRMKDSFFINEIFSLVYVPLDQIVTQNAIKFNLSKPIFEKLLQPSKRPGDHQKRVKMLNLIPITSNLKSVIRAFMETGLNLAKQDDDINLDGLNESFKLFKNSSFRGVIDHSIVNPEFSDEIKKIIEAWTEGLVKHGHMNFLLWKNKGHATHNNFELITKERAQVLTSLISNLEEITNSVLSISLPFFTKLTHLPHAIRNILENHVQNKETITNFQKVMQEYLDRTESIYNDILIKLVEKLDYRTHSHHIKHPHSNKKILLKIINPKPRVTVHEFLYRGLMQVLKNDPRVGASYILFLEIAGNDDLFSNHTITWSENPFYTQLHPSVISSALKLKQRYFHDSTLLKEGLVTLREQVRTYLDDKARSSEIEMSRLGYHALIWFEVLLPLYPEHDALDLTSENAFLLIWRALSCASVVEKEGGQAYLEQLRIALFKKVLIVKSLRHDATSSDISCFALNTFMNLISGIHPVVTVSKFMSLNTTSIIHDVFNSIFQSLSSLEQELIILRSYQVLLSQANKSITFPDCLPAFAERRHKTELTLSEFDRQTLHKKFIEVYQSDINAQYVTCESIEQSTLRPWRLFTFSSVEHRLNHPLDKDMLQLIQQSIGLMKPSSVQNVTESLKRGITNSVPAEPDVSALNLLASLAIKKPSTLRLPRNQSKMLITIHPTVSTTFVASPKLGHSLRVPNPLNGHA